MPSKKIVRVMSIVLDIKGPKIIYVFADIFFQYPQYWETSYVSSLEIAWPGIFIFFFVSISSRIVAHFVDIDLLDLTVHDMPQVVA